MNVIPKDSPSPRKIRIELAPDDVFEMEVVPFAQLSVADHIRIYETPEEDAPRSSSPFMQQFALKQSIAKRMGIPYRFVMAMKLSELEGLVQTYSRWTKENDPITKSLNTVFDTLKDFKEANQREWGVNDAREIMHQHGIFRSEVTINGEVYRAPASLDGDTLAGQWVELLDTFSAHQGQPESEMYARACGTLMLKEGEKWPTMGKGETAEEFNERFLAWRLPRDKVFMNAPWVEVMGCAAFFFLHSMQFAAITAHSLTRFTILRPSLSEPEVINMPSSSELHGLLFGSSPS